MATLVLQTAGAAAGALFGPVGAAVGRAVGGLAGAVIDRALIPGERSRGPRLESLDVQTSTEGAPVPRVYGRVRIAGQVIWATRLEEETREEGGGGKGLGGAQRSYRYFANFAVGLCEGKVDRIGRVWADGKPLDLAGVTMRRYRGGEFQEPDPLIEAKQGDAPAYRGLAYVVFERLPLDPYGNRLPQLTFEVIRAVDALEGMVQAVTLIPGATEFGYATAAVTREGAPGVTIADNRHVGTAASDFEAAIDELVDLCPALERVALVVAWFADDLRASHCRPRPKIEDADRRTRGATWEVDGVTRDEAEVTSRVEGRPAYGGTPSDDSVVAAIRSLNARGLKVTFYPFLLMDVPPGNDLPDPWGGGEQAAFPWRGRITVHPAPGREGSPDGTGDAADEIAGFVGEAVAADFDIDGDRVRYTGAAEWSWRRMILHYAHLCKVAGGVDAFLIGSELIGLTTVRSARRDFPFVQALRDLAADVSDVLPGSTLVSYAADWSEFFGYRPDDGSGDHLFHLDRLWTSPHVDFVGIDVYWPLADWRDGDHLDAAAARSIYEPAYLGGNVAGGEGYDWYYPTAEARRNQDREPITDGMHGKCNAQDRMACGGGRGIWRALPGFDGTNRRGAWGGRPSEARSGGPTRDRRRARSNGRISPRRTALKATAVAKWRGNTGVRPDRTMQSAGVAANFARRAKTAEIRHIGPAVHARNFAVTRRTVFLVCSACRYPAGDETVGDFRRGTPYQSARTPSMTAGHPPSSPGSSHSPNRRWRVSLLADVASISKKVARPKRPSIQYTNSALTGTTEHATTTRCPISDLKSINTSLIDKTLWAIAGDEDAKQKASTVQRLRPIVPNRMIISPPAAASAPTRKDAQGLRRIDPLVPTFQTRDECKPASS